MMNMTFNVAQLETSHHSSPDLQQDEKNLQRLVYVMRSRDLEKNFADISSYISKVWCCWVYDRYTDILYDCWKLNRRKCLINALFARSAVCFKFATKTQSMRWVDRPCKNCSKQLCACCICHLWSISLPLVHQRRTYLTSKQYVIELERVNFPHTITSFANCDKVALVKGIYTNQRHNHKVPLSLSLNCPLPSCEGSVLSGGASRGGLVSRFQDLRPEIVGECFEATAHLSNGWLCFYVLPISLFLYILLLLFLFNVLATRCRTCAMFSTVCRVFCNCWTWAVFRVFCAVCCRHHWRHTFLRLTRSSNWNAIKAWNFYTSLFSASYCFFSLLNGSVFDERLILF